jgi:hypothetical protein
MAVSLLLMLLSLTICRVSNAPHRVVGWTTHSCGAFRPWSPRRPLRRAQSGPQGTLAPGSRLVPGYEPAKQIDDLERAPAAIVMGQGANVPSGKTVQRGASHRAPTADGRRPMMRHFRPTKLPCRQLADWPKGNRESRPASLLRCTRPVPGDRGRRPNRQDRCAARERRA